MLDSTSPPDLQATVLQNYNPQGHLFYKPCIAHIFGKYWLQLFTLHANLSFTDTKQSFVYNQNYLEIKNIEQAICLSAKLIVHV